MTKFLFLCSGKVWRTRDLTWRDPSQNRCEPAFFRVKSRLQTWSRFKGLKKGVLIRMEPMYIVHSRVVKVEGWQIRFYWQFWAKTKNIVPHLGFDFRRFLRFWAWACHKSGYILNNCSIRVKNVTNRQHGHSNTKTGKGNCWCLEISMYWII